MIAYVLAAANQSAMEPAGRQAHLIAQTWWIYFYITLAVYAATMLFVLAVGNRSRAHRQRAGDEAPRLQDEARESRLTRFVTGSVALSTVILFVLMVSDFVYGRQYHALSAETDINLKVTGKQWWWLVHYKDSLNPSQSVATANEIWLPVGKTVRIDLDSSDVIHSFWVPNLAGKKDAIPGHPTSMWLRADQEGKYEGQCAEFCGLDHAKMRLVVNVVSQERYDQWYQAQLASAAEPQTDLQRRGKDVFMSSTCVMCHTISGTQARATVGPNLSHIGSRQTLAAGSLPNLPEQMASWVQNPQQIKPGVHMPQHNLPPDDLAAVVEYLESLK